MVKGMNRGVSVHAGPAGQGQRTGASEYPPGEAELARRVVALVGGRYSAGLGIDVDAGDAEVERWFVAATLFGARIPARVAERTFGVLAAAGLARIGQMRHVPSADLIAMLDAGGYARYDIRTAERLLELCEVIRDRYDGQAAVIGRRFTTYPELHAALDALPGWGPVTVRLFLRELRETWPGARPPLDERAAAAARHLGLAAARAGLTGLAGLAAASGLDVRDLESGLVRLMLAHGRAMARCPGGQACTALQPPGPS
jgi:endonuclease III